MKTDQEMLESLKKRQKIYIRERNRKLRIYGAVAGCFLALAVVIQTVPLFMKKSQDMPDTFSNELEMRIESIRDIKTASNKPADNDSPEKSEGFNYQMSTVNDVSLYSFDCDGSFVCVQSDESYQNVFRAMESVTGKTISAEENEICEFALNDYFVCWHDESGYCGLYGSDTTKENFTAVYHKLTHE